MQTLTNTEILEIASAKKGDKKYQTAVHRNAKLFFTTILLEPAFAHYLDYIGGTSDQNYLYFFAHFKGEKSDAKFNELNATLSYFVLLKTFLLVTVRQKSNQ